MHILYDLAAHPEYIEPRREEIESLVLSAQGWEAKTVMKMYKLDSVLKESLRIHCSTCNFSIFEAYCYSSWHSPKSDDIIPILKRDHRLPESGKGFCGQLA